MARCIGKHLASRLAGTLTRSSEDLPLLGLVPIGDYANRANGSSVSVQSQSSVAAHREVRYIEFSLDRCMFHHRLPCGVVL